MALHPNTELVAVEWLKGVTGIPSGQVATMLPDDNTTWSASGFVQVVTVVGGSPAVDFLLAQPVVQVDCWAVNPDSGKPPWGKAHQLAEYIRWGVHASAGKRDLTTFPAAYNDARVLEVNLTSEPRRVPSDEASYARYTCELSIKWIELEA